MSDVATTYEALRTAINALGNDIEERARGHGTSVAFRRRRNFACITKRSGWVQLDVLLPNLEWKDRLRVGAGELDVSTAVARVRNSYQFGNEPRR